MLPEASTARLADFLAAHPSLIEWLHAQSKATRWSISREEFAAVLFRSAAHRFGGDLPSAEILEPYLRALHLEDLALACALRRGEEQAWEEFVARYRPLLYAAARAVAGSGGETRARELADSLYAELYGLDRGGVRRSSLLDYFHGRSKLATWLRSVLAQRYVDTLRSAQRTESLDDEDRVHGHAASRSRAEAPGAGGPDHDPVRELDRKRLLPRLRGAFSSVLADLNPSDRLILSLYYGQELTLAQIARLRGVHEATISRQLNYVRAQLRESTERALAAGRPAENGHASQPGLSPAEIQLCFEYALEDWPFDLGSALPKNAVQETETNGAQEIRAASFKGKAPDSKARQ